MWEFEAIGTHWSITIPDDTSEEKHARLKARVLSRIDQFDKNYSRFRNDSLVTEMSKNAGTHELPEDAQSLFDLYFELYKVTDGAYTPLIGQVLSDAGYDANYSLQQSTPLTNPAHWEDVLEYNFPKLTLKNPALLDFGAAGKGYLVDIVAEIIKDEGIESFCVNAGGDIRYESASEISLSVGLENPDDTTQAIGIASLTKGSLCGSAGNRRAWGSFHHIISPHTLKSPREVKAVWVTAPTALVADALTTCLFFMSPEELLARLPEKYVFEYLLLNSENAFDMSPGFPAEIFTS